MARHLRPAGVAVAVLAAALLGGCLGGPEDGVLRLGYFANLTHAQPLYGLATGLYTDHLNGTRLDVQVFNAGPTALESLLARRVDVIYVGPSPTITAIDRKGTDVVVIIAGAASGGAFFVTRADITRPEDLRGRTVASPQLGNTQDVALKHYLREHGLQRTDEGGDVKVINAGNPDLLSYFRNGHIDGAWVAEPWATRLVLEGGGRVLVDEVQDWPDGKFVTTHLVTTRSFLRERPADITALLAAHAEATRILQAGGPEVLDAVNDGIEQATGKRIADGILAAAFPNINFTNDPLTSTFGAQYAMAHDLGFARAAPDLAQVYDLSLLPSSG